MFWGLTPALDLLEEYSKINRSLAELNILLVGGSDLRHVLQTLSRRYRHATIKLNFFILEISVESIAKQLLLLNVALQSFEVMGSIKRTKIFMELYGNTLVRPSVARYLATMAAELTRMVTSYDHLKTVMPCVTLHIKYKERDYLENLLKFWCGGDDFNICDCWDRRLRKNLGARYDTKEGVFDWDLHMRLHSVGASQICGQEYRHFRLRGVAFTWLESEVSKPNRSMVCVAVPNGEKFYHYGYLGEMETGPFISYGLQCEDQDFLKSTNGQNVYRATDVTERNLSQIFHEIHYQQEYCHKPTSDLKLGCIITREEDQPLVDVTQCEQNIKKKNKCIELEDVQIQFASFSLLEKMKYKNNYNGFFNIVYFASSYFKHLDKSLIDCITANDALILIENKKYLVNVRDKQLQEFSEEIHKVLNGAKIKKLSFDPCKDDYAKFVKVN